MASSSNPPPPERDFPANDISPLAQDMVLNHTFDLQAKNKLFSLQDYLILNYDMTSLCFQNLGIHVVTHFWVPIKKMRKYKKYQKNIQKKSKK
jgi:hypothetical protein